MKKNTQFVICLLLVFVPVTLLSQISITMADVQVFFGTGKSTKSFSRADTVSYQMNVGITSSSQAQTWTYPAAVFTDSIVNANVAPSTTPYVSTFPGATHAKSQIMAQGLMTSSVYMYYRMANDSLSFLGYAANIKYPPIMDTTTYMKFGYLMTKTPLMLGSTLLTKDSSFSSMTNYSSALNVENFDAYGTITLPNGTFQCLRAKVTSYVQTMLPTGLTKDTLYAFHWLTKEGHELKLKAKLKSATSGTIPVMAVNYVSIIPSTGVASFSTGMPTALVLSQNYPNPFNPSTTIEFTLAKSARATVKVYDVVGREAATLIDADLESGTVHRVSFDASHLPSGIYFCTLRSGTEFQMKKLILMK